MSKYVKTDTFRPQDAREIVAELQLQDSELVMALLEMRSPSSRALRQRVQTLTNTETVKGTRNADEPRRERMFSFLPRFVLRVGVVAALLLVAVLMMSAVVPSVRAALGRVMQQRFGLVLVEPTLEAIPAAETELEEGEGLTEEAIPPISLEEAQAQVPFTIPMPRLLPEGFAVWAARVGTGPHGESTDENGNRITMEPPIQVILHFKPDEEFQRQYHPDATLGLTILNQIGIEGGYTVPAGSEEEVEVNSNSAVFVRGAWVRPDESQPPPSDNINWDDMVDVVMLSWEADGFTYILHGYYLGLSQEDYIKIAESVG
jgi:hypothetical protein